MALYQDWGARNVVVLAHGTVCLVDSCNLQGINESI